MHSIQILIHQPLILQTTNHLFFSLDLLVGWRSRTIFIFVLCKKCTPFLSLPLSIMCLLSYLPSNQINKSPSNISQSSLLSGETRKVTSRCLFRSGSNQKHIRWKRQLSGIVYKLLNAKKVICINGQHSDQSLVQQNYSDLLGTRVGQYTNVDE